MPLIDRSEGRNGIELCLLGVSILTRCFRCGCIQRDHVRAGQLAVWPSLKLCRELIKQGHLCSEGHYCARRSEEHTSELQSLMRISYAVFCLKKKKTER